MELNVVIGLVAEFISSGSYGASKTIKIRDEGHLIRVSFSYIFTWMMHSAIQPPKEGKKSLKDNASPQFKVVED